MPDTPRPPGPMTLTVAQLIARLQELPPDLPVYSTVECSWVQGADLALHDRFIYDPPSRIRDIPCVELHE